MPISLIVVLAIWISS